MLSMFTTNNKLIVFLAAVSTLLFLFLLTFLFLSGEKEVSIKTNPESADFTINGRSGKTPATVKMKPGTYKLEVNKVPYKSISQDVKISRFGKKVELEFKLEEIPFKPTAPFNKEAFNKDFNDYYAKFPYANDLPAKGDTFYISRPSNEGMFNVYIYKEYEEQGKKDTYKWFSGHGVKDPESLNINWVYSKLK